jgi:hypothetical protein
MIWEEFNSESFGTQKARHERLYYRCSGLRGKEWLGNGEARMMNDEIGKCGANACLASIFSFSGRASGPPVSCWFAPDHYQSKCPLTEFWDNFWQMCHELARENLVNSRAE